MSGHELTLEGRQKKLDFVAQAFAWKLHEVEVQHERDWDCSWTARVWCDADGKRLFDQEDLEPAMLEELHRIACYYKAGR